MANLPAMTARLGVDNKQWTTGLDKAGKDADAFGGRVVNMSRQMENSLKNPEGLTGLPAVLNRNKNAFTQLSFAADDFFGVLAAGGGASAAIRSTSNNIGTLVTMMNPLAGLATTLGLTLGSMLIPKLFDTGDAAEDAGSGLDKLRDKIDKTNREIDTLYSRASDQRRVGGITNADSIANEQERVRAQIAQTQAKLEALDKYEQDLRSQAKTTTNPYTGETISIFDESQREQFDELTKRIEESRRDLDSLQRQLGTLNQNAKVAQKKGVLSKSGGILGGAANAAVKQATELAAARAKALEAAAKARGDVVDKFAKGSGEAGDDPVSVAGKKIAQQGVAGFADRGTTQAFSAIVQATSGRGDKKQAEIAKSTKATAKATQALAKSAIKKSAMQLEVVDL